MFINKAKDGSNNICSQKIAYFRIKIGLSQRMLAEKLQVNGLDVDKNAIQRIEAGKRFVTDIELLAFSNTFNVSLIELINEDQ